MSEFELSEFSDEEIESMSVDGLGLYILSHLSENIDIEWDLNIIVSTLIYRSDSNGNITRRTAPAFHVHTSRLRMAGELLVIKWKSS